MATLRHESSQQQPATTNNRLPQQQQQLGPHVPTRSMPVLCLTLASLTHSNATRFGKQLTDTFTGAAMACDTGWTGWRSLGQCFPKADHDDFRTFRQMWISKEEDSDHHDYHSAKSREHRGHPSRPRGRPRVSDARRACTHRSF